MKKTSELQLHVEACTSGYQNAHTAADTAAIDAQIPPSDGRQALGKGKTCESYRKAGTAK